MSRSGRSTSALTEATTSSVQDVSESQVDFGVDHGGVIQSSAELLDVTSSIISANGNVNCPVRSMVLQAPPLDQPGSNINYQVEPDPSSDCRPPS
uniref:Uncharacterized protein n=1 Tax=Trichuris muris TaxID=70415 RepID=A0A5S6QHT5_TRIMR